MAEQISTRGHGLAILVWGLVLGAGTGAQIRLGTKRYANQPTLAWPW